jgi:hypothetical protein
MTDGMIAVLGGVAMVASMIGQVFDSWLTMKGLDNGFVEVGPINKYFIKSKADEGKIPAISFAEAAATLVAFGVVFSVAGPTSGLVFASTLAASVWANDIRNIVVLKKAKIKIFG